MRFGESILFAFCAVTPLLVGLFLGFTHIGFAMVSAVFAVAYPVFFMRDLAIPSDQRGDRIQNAFVVGVCGIVGIFAVQCAMVPAMGYQVAFLVMMAAQSAADYFFISDFVEFSNPHLNNQDRLSKIATHQSEYWQYVCGLSGCSLLMVAGGHGQAVLGFAASGVVYMAFWVLHLFKADPVSPNYAPRIKLSTDAGLVAGICAIGLTLIMTNEMLMTFVIQPVAVVRVALWTVMIIGCNLRIWTRTN